MTIKQFIEKAIEGGYKRHDLKQVGCPILLDPLAWQAVGKMKGWKKGRYGLYNHHSHGDWYFYMHDMIDALVEGKSLEEFLETL